MVRKVGRHGRYGNIFSVRLQPAQRERLRQLSAAMGCRDGEVVRRLIERAQIENGGKLNEVNSKL